MILRVDPVEYPDPNRFAETLIDSGESDPRWLAGFLAQEGWEMAGCTCWEDDEQNPEVDEALVHTLAKVLYAAVTCGRDPDAIAEAGKRACLLLEAAGSAGHRDVR